MGCQCANKEDENKSEILKEIEEEAGQNEENNNNYNSNSKEGIFGLEGLNQNENQEKPPSEKPMKTKKNLLQKNPITKMIMISMKMK